MFNEEEYPAERSELLAWAAGAMAHAYEWPPVPTKMFGLILSSRPAGPESPMLHCYQERLFIGQCPKTLLMHVETHANMKAPAPADFARRATKAIEGLRADADSLPALLKAQTPTSKELFMWVSRSGAGKSAALKSLIEPTLESLPRYSRIRKR
jgi:hypothetical protein